MSRGWLQFINALVDLLLQSFDVFQRPFGHQCEQVRIFGENILLQVIQRADEPFQLFKAGLLLDPSHGRLRNGIRRVRNTVWPELPFDEISIEPFASSIFPAHSES